MPGLRFRVECRDVPPVVAARKLGLTLEAFTAKLPDLIKRNFPPADPTTGNFDLKAIDRWQDARYPQLSTDNRTEIAGASPIAADRIRDRLRALSK